MPIRSHIVPVRNYLRQARVTVAEGFANEVPGLFAWFDANQISGIADGGLVATWPDLSGNSDDFSQSTGTNQPTWLANLWGNKSVLQFSPPAYMQAVTLAQGGGGANMTLAMVVQQVAHVRNSALISLNTGANTDHQGSTGGAIGWQGFDAPQTTRYNVRRADAVQAYTPRPTSGPGVVMFTFDGTNVRGYLNNVLDNETVVGGSFTFTQAALNVKRDGTLHDPGNMYMAEIAFWDNAISVEYRAYIVDAWIKKWAIVV